MPFYNSISDKNNFVIGFNQSPQKDFGVFAKSYSNAASALAKLLLERPRFSDHEAYPVVFLYRHAFELYLKSFYTKLSLISSFKNIQSVVYQSFYNHKLKPLAISFREISKILYPSDHKLKQLSDKVYTYAVEFEEIDRNSFGYRYPVDTKGNRSTNKHQVVNLLALHNSMTVLFEELEMLDFGLSMEESQAQEIYEIIQEVQSIIETEE